MENLKAARATHFYPQLESLRGLAALLVVFYHLPPWWIGYQNVPLISNCYLMVDLFFVLSGFVIALNYEHKLKSWSQLGHFTRLRFVRLYPVHLVFLIG